MNVTTDLLAQLTADGDAVALDDTRTLVLHIEQDDVGPMEHINDADCWGRVAWGRTDRNTGNDVRPDGFTGAARKFQIYGYALEGTVWWEPYREGHKVYDDAEQVAEMRRLLSDGFQCVSLALREVVTDSLGGEHVETIWTAGLGGVDSLEDGYLAEVIEELAAELPIDC